MEMVENCGLLELRKLLLILIEEQRGVYCYRVVHYLLSELIKNVEHKFSFGLKCHAWKSTCNT